MDNNRKNSLSLWQSETEYFNDQQDKIELVGCPFGGKLCQEHRMLINNSYSESNRNRRDKNYHQSIEALERAFVKTMELTEFPCNKCAAFYRSTITESVEVIQSELHKMSTGLFRTRRFHSSYEKVEEVLKEFKEVV